MNNVGWDTKYSIDIKQMDGETVYHLGAALKKYLTEVQTIGGDAAATFREITEVCETITIIDEKD